MSFLIPNKKLSYWVGACILLGFLSCKKSDPLKNELSKLPATTQTGANTFGYLINGVAVSTSKIYCSYNGTAAVGTTDYSYVFILTGVDSTAAGKQTVTLGIPGLVITDNSGWTLEYPNPYGPGDDLIRPYAEYNITDNVTTTDYQTAFPPAYGVIFFTKIDTLKKIVSGTFSFVGSNTTHPNVNVTDGRFDVHYTNK